MTEDLRKSSTRYPYTYACDYIRMLGPVSRSGVVLSRSDASQIRQGIAKALGMDDEELAKKLADAELKHEDNPESMRQQVNRFVQALKLNDTDLNYWCP